MEQLGSAWLTPAYLALVARADALWEFAPSHAPRWAAAARRLRALAPPDLRPAPAPSPAPAADLLFYGCGNARRAALRDACAALLAPRGFRVDFRLGFDLFGAARDDAARRAKIVLNAHFYEGAALETHRLNYLLQRRACSASADRDLDALYARGVSFAAYGDLPRAALALLEDAGARRDASAAAAALAAELPRVAAAWADVR
ncbi:hypothetical protein JL722_7424 [Aureococcus anophagefferens]|nr:hypothetical protein JL722_7424 [Aureococcus anophagefferens]